jgi:hypothetical protein
MRLLAGDALSDEAKQSLLSSYGMRGRTLQQVLDVGVELGKLQAQAASYLRDNCGAEIGFDPGCLLQAMLEKLDHPSGGSSSE